MSWQTIVKENNLEVSVISASNLEGAIRLDSDYYQVKYLKNKKFLGSKECKTILELTDYVKKGIFDISPEKYLESGVPIIRVKDIKDGFLDYSTTVFISEEDHIKEKKTELNVGDIVFSKVGTVGEVALIDKKSNFSQNVIGIKIKRKEINPKYLLCFLLSPAGNYQIKRAEMISVQPKLELIDIRELLVPVASPEFQDYVASIVDASKNKKDGSLKTYIEAEQVFLREINLEGYKGNEEAISVRNLSESLADNRFDAEYWQPDFDVILETISEYKKGVSTIGDEFKQLKGNFKAEKDKEYSYVEIGDINVSTGEVDSNVIIGAELPINAKIKFGKRQLITSKVRPNRGATAILDNHEGYIGSGAFTVLIEQDSINLETLMVYLKAKPIRELLLRYNTGTSYPVITDSDVLKLPIPMIDKVVQNKISELVRASAKEREKAKVLLEKAKRAVEIFVEKDEREALIFLSDLN